jgi:hypothetical protein
VINQPKAITDWGSNENTSRCDTLFYIVVYVIHLYNMDNSSTRIADLPENITINPYGQQGQQGQQGYPGQQGQQGYGLGQGIGQGHNPEYPQTYTQMNVHPNPYGQNAPQIGALPPPQHTHVFGKNQHHDGQGHGQGQGNPPYLGNMEQPQFPLPNRDIPIDTAQYQQDEQVAPNYIPEVEESKKFVIQEKEKKRKKKQKHANWNFDDMIAEFQQPIIIVVLFLIFQAPTINQMMAKHLAFLHLFGEDGDLNTNGILFKSSVFGFMYLVLCKFLTYIDQ